MILLRFAAVITATAIAVTAMINFKDWVNRSESVLAMDSLGKAILRYRTENGSVPPESYVNNIKSDLPGNVRVGDMRYRALWISFDSPPDTILAYTEKKYHSLFLHNGVIVLRLNGHVEWMDTHEFETLLAKQQSPVEKQMQK